MEVIKDYGPTIFLLIVNAFVFWVSWSMRKAFATKADHESRGKEMTAIASRVQKLELVIEHMPKKDDFHSLQEELSAAKFAIQQMPTKDELHGLQLELAEAVGEIKLARAEYGSIMGLMTRMESVVTRHEQIFVDAARSR
jgi:hypothetical protein